MSAATAITAAGASAAWRPTLSLAVRYAGTLGALRRARADIRRPSTAATNPSRASAKASPRGSSTWRARKNPVSAKPSAMSSSDGVTVLRQERRQPQQPVLPGRAGVARHRAAGFRRHVAEIALARRSRRSLSRSRPKPSSASICSSKRTISGAGRHRIVEMIEHGGELIVHLRMRIALRQQPAQRRQMRDAIDHMRRPQAARRHAGAAARRRSGRDARRAARARPRARVLPGCSTGRSREPPPPRTRPRWRPWSRVITSRMALASPWRRVPSTMPSSVHSMAQS